MTRRILLCLVALIILPPATVLALANIPLGRRLIEREAHSLTGGMVLLQGLHGRFPDALRLDHLEIRDARGVWLTLDGVVLDWSPTALLGRRARIDRLAAARIDVRRLPVPAAAPAAGQPPAKGGFSLPVQVELRVLAVARLEVAAPVAGAAAALKLAGNGRFRSLQDAAVALSADRLDGPGTYRVDGAVDAAAIRALVDAGEPAGGLVAGLAGLPALGALALHATLEGPRAAEALRLTLGAGPLQAAAQGSIDLTGQTAALDVSASAPAMKPRPDVSWDSLALTAHVHGAFIRPDVSAHAELTHLLAGGASIARLALDAGGNQGTLDAHAVATGLLLPPPQPNLFAAAPLDIAVHARLDQPGRPVHVAIAHPTLTAEADLLTAGNLSARIHTAIPDLRPFAAIGHADIAGSADAMAELSRHDGISDVAVDGTARFTGGQAPLPTVLGATRFGATARLDGQDITISRAVVDGRAAHLDATGTDLGGHLALAWHVVLSDLAALSPQVAGALDARGRADTQPAGPADTQPTGAAGTQPSGPAETQPSGPGETQPSGLAVVADIKGDIGTKAVPRGPIAVQARIAGLPASPAGTIRAQGRLAGAPLTLEAAVSRQPDGGLHASLTRAAWKSLDASAEMTLPRGATVPLGTLQAKMTRLADLSALVGQSLAGSLSAKVAIARDAAAPGSVPDARLDLQAAGLAVGSNAVGRLSVTGHVRDPVADPDASLAIAATGIAAGGVTGQAHATLAGPQTALLARADAALDVRGEPATASLAARLDAKAHDLLLSSLAASYKGEALLLRAPARIGFGAVTGVDRLALSLGPAGTPPALLELAGRVAPTLSLTASLRQLTPALARPFAPDLHAAGTLTADARLSGTAAAPLGSLRLHGAGLRLIGGPAASLPPAGLDATATLAGSTARIDARIAAGPKLSASARGSVPLRAGAAIALRLAAATDLSLLDPVLGATGQRAAGQLALAASVGGSTAHPAIDGTLTLVRGEFQDYAQGLRLTDIAARLDAAGDTIRIVQASARAGGGTLGASGSIGVLAPGIPVDIQLTASHARPLASDLLTATLDASLALRGQASTELAASGRIFVRGANINIPDALPPGVAVLHVRRPGDKPPPARAAPAAVVRLAITLDAPSQVFVRGHGLDSELGGTLTIGGTTAAPQIAGGLEMRRGDISVAGTTLTFSHGEVGFDGTSVTNRIDPTLDFVADSTSGGVTATLTVGGYADAPTIKLSSVPDLPQDEVLAHLLFGTSVKDLSAIQIAEIAGALAELTGVTGGGSDPLGAIRKGLGLDRLSVGSGSGTGATVEAGRYVARGVYVGAKQNTSGGTAAEVQIDLTKRLKLKAQLATGGGTVQGATPDNDPGSTIGLSYQFQY